MTARRVLALILGALGIIGLIALVFGNQWTLEFLYKHDLAQSEGAGRLVAWLTFPYWRLTPQGSYSNLLVNDFALILLLVAIGLLIMAGARALDPNRGVIGALILGWWATVIGAGLAGLIRGALLLAVNDYPGSIGSSFIWNGATSGACFGLFYGWLPGLAALFAFLVTRTDNAAAPYGPPGMPGGPQPGAQVPPQRGSWGPQGQQAWAPPPPRPGHAPPPPPGAHMPPQPSGHLAPPPGHAPPPGYAPPPPGYAPPPPGYVPPPTGYAPPPVSPAGGDGDARSPRPEGPAEDPADAPSPEAGPADAPLPGNEPADPPSPAERTADLRSVVEESAKRPRAAGEAAPGSPDSLESDEGKDRLPPPA